MRRQKAQMPYTWHTDCQLLSIEYAQHITRYCPITTFHIFHIILHCPLQSPIVRKSNMELYWYVQHTKVLWNIRIVFLPGIVPFCSKEIYEIHASLVSRPKISGNMSLNLKGQYIFNVFRFLFKMKNIFYFNKVINFNHILYINR